MSDFGCKADIGTDPPKRQQATSDFAELPCYGEKACGEYRLVALR
jgi:hypothetical protein